MDLESKRLRLKEVTGDDLSAIHRLHSFPEVDEFNTIGIPRDLDDTKEKIRAIIEGQSVIPQKSFTWTIVLKDSAEFIGLAGISLSLDKF